MILIIILLIIGLISGAITIFCCNQYNEVFMLPCLIMLLVSLITLAVFGCLTGTAIYRNVTAPAAFRAYEIKYDTLTYQLENNLYDNNNNIGLKELFDEIYDYNQEIESGRINSKSPMISVLYPLDYDSLKLIELP